MNGKNKKCVYAAKLEGILQSLFVFVMVIGMCIVASNPTFGIFLLMTGWFLSEKGKNLKYKKTLFLLQKRMEN